MRSSRQTGVQVWNRQLGQAVPEPVYRGGSLQFLFHNYLGRLLMRHVLPYRFVNNLITWRQRSRISKREIRPFVEYYKIDTSEFKQPIDEFRSFAEFFVRELHPETRPISPGARELVSPCDGRIEWIKEPLGPETGFVVKGQQFTLSSVLAEPNLAEKFAGGSIIGLYLAPFDYHRFCYPLQGRVLLQRRKGNRYYSVNEDSIASGFRAYDANIRHVTILQGASTIWGMVEIAGLYAGRIIKLDGEDLDKDRGTMKGYFDIGGSFILLVFPAGTMQLDADIRQPLSTGRPVRVKMGEKIGTMLSEDTTA